MCFISEYIVLAELIILFCTIYIIVILHFCYYSALSKIKKRKKYYDEMTTVLSEDYIQLICKLSESKTRWEEFTQVFEGKEYYLLSNSVRSSVLIPKSVFITEEDKHWFEDKLKKGLMVNKH